MARRASSQMGTPFDNLEFAIPPDRLARLSALPWSMGAIIGVAGSLLPHGPGVNVAGWLVLSASAAVIAGFSLWQGVNKSVSMQYVLAVLAVVIISSALLVAHHTPTMYAVAGLFVLLAAYAATFFTTGAYVTNLVTQAVVSAIVFFTSGLAAAPAAWAMTITTSTTVGIVVRMLREALTRAAVADPLTGLMNRRSFEPTFVRELARSARDGTSLCIVVIDLDHFKAVNDKLGHRAGDHLLVEVTAAWSAELRPVDVLARTGGDEFTLLLPSTRSDEAAEILLRLRSSSTQPFSAGIARTETGGSTDELLHEADSACYLAKSNGGDQVVVAGDPSHPIDRFGDPRCRTDRPDAQRRGA